MARFVRSKVVESTGSTSLTPVLPAHENGDLILAFMGNDFTNNTYSTVTSGWTKEVEVSGSAIGACFSFYATGSGSTNPTFTTSSGRGWEVAMVVVKDAPTSSAIDVSATLGPGSINRALTATVTTTTDNCLLFEYAMVEENNRQMFFEPEVNQIAAMNGGSVSFEHSSIMAWHVQPSAGLSTGHTFANRFSGFNGIRLTIAIKDDGNDNFPGYVDPTIPPADMITPWAGTNVVGYYDDGAKDVDPTSLITTINGDTATYEAKQNFDAIYPSIATCGFSITSSGDWDKHLVFQRGSGNVWDLSGDNLLSFSGLSEDTSVDFNTGARYIGVGSGDSANVATAAKLFQVESSDSRVRMNDGSVQFVVQPSATADDTYGSIDLTSIEKLFMSTYVTSSDQDHGFGFLYKLQTMTLIGGSAANPCELSVAASHAKTGLLNTVSDQKGSAASQFFCTQNIRTGNGTDLTYWDSSFQSIEYPASYNATDVNVAVNVNSAVFLYDINAAAGDTVIMKSCTFNMGDFHKWEINSATSNTDIYNFTGLNVLNATVTLQDKSNIAYSGMAFSGCKEIIHNGADLSLGNTISNSADTYAITVTSEAGFDKLANCTFTGNTNAIRITGDQTGSWSEPNLVVSGNTNDISYSGTTDFSIQSAATLSVDNTSSGTLTIVTPVLSYEIVSSESGSFIQIFTTGTQTVLDSTTGTSLDYVFTGTVVVDYVVQKAGFVLQRFTGITLTDSSVTINLVASREYDASHGLTYTTDASWSRSLNQLTIPTFGVTGQQVFSLMLDSFISESSLYNTAFNIEMDGTGSLYLTNDAEGATDASIENLTDCGCAYLDPDGVTTASWSGILSVGVATGFQGEYQQIDGTTTTDARATGAFNELIKVFGDASHGNFDYTGHLVLKYQPNTYRESRSDIIDSYSLTALAPTLYIVAMEPVVIDITAGDPAISITIVDHTGVPLVVGGKSFDYEIQDNGSNNGDAMLREVNYNLSQDAVYQGKDPFNWPEMILKVGSIFQTIYGIVEGDSGLHGVYVSRSAADHPDFVRHQSNDGTYYVKPITANGSISSIVSGSRLRIYNETTATETYNDIPGTSYSINYTEGTTYTAGDVISIYLTQTSGITAQLPFDTSVIASSTGWTVIAAQVSDDVYDSYGLNGSSITKFAADYVNDEVDVTVASNFSAQEFYAWWSYNLTLSQGISDFYGGITALDAANLRINNPVVSIYLDNTTSTNVWQTDNIRIYRTDEAYPVKNPTSGGGGIDVVWRDKVFIAETGVSGLTASESTQLAVIDTVDNKIGIPVDTVSEDIANISAGGGDATEANQDLILADLNIMKGAGFSTGSDSLESIRDRGDEAWRTFETPAEKPEPPVV